ncbi:transposase [Roseomonas sp. GCM10028921]
MGLRPGPDFARISRGDLTVWISPDLAWHVAEGTGRRGRPQVYTDAAIQAVLLLKVLYQLPLRAAQGVAESLGGQPGSPRPTRDPA